MEILEMKQRRAALVKEARKLLDTAETENRELTGEETQKYEEMMKDVDSWGTKIEREENLRKMEETLKEPEEKLPTQTEKPEERKDAKETEEYRKSFDRFLRNGISALTEKEFRAMQAEDPEGGGYLVAPQTFVSEMLKDVDNTVFMRTLARKFSLGKAESLGVPKLDTDFTSADWVSELDTGDEDTLDFGKRELRPHALSKLVKLSNKLIRNSVTPIESMVRERLAYVFSTTMENAYLNGTGLQQPLGIFVASDDGISTGRDVSTGNTTTSIKADGLIEAKYTLATPYLRNARWVFHRDALKQIRSAQGWRRSVPLAAWYNRGQSGQHSRNSCHNERIRTKYLHRRALRGSSPRLSYYWIADALDMQVQRLVELYAATNQIGYLARLESDGAICSSKAHSSESHWRLDKE